MIECLLSEDLIELLIKCKQSLTSNGFIVVKENTVSEGLEVQKKESAIMRSVSVYRSLFK